MVDKFKLAKRLLDKLLKQQSEGIPIQAQGFLSHPFTGNDLPDVNHRIGRERPQFVIDSTDGWEIVK